MPAMCDAKVSISDTFLPKKRNSDQTCHDPQHDLDAPCRPGPTPDYVSFTVTARIFAKFLRVAP
jgi:hypothetical protein